MVNSLDVTVKIETNADSPQQFLVGCVDLVDNFSDYLVKEMDVKLIRGEYELIRQFLIFLYYKRGGISSDDSECG